MKTMRGIDVRAAQSRERKRAGGLPI